MTPWAREARGCRCNACLWRREAERALAERQYEEWAHQQRVWELLRRLESPIWDGAERVRLRLALGDMFGHKASLWQGIRDAKRAWAAAEEKALLAHSRKEGLAVERHGDSMEAIGAFGRGLLGEKGASR